MQYMKIEDCNELLEGEPRLIQQQLNDYVIFLREENNLTATTINTRMAAIKKFSDTNDIDLEKDKVVCR